MSGVFSMASHWALQYLPDVVMHEQTGCAHFSAFAVAISFLLALDPKQRIQALNSSHPKNLRLYRSEHIAIWDGISPTLQLVSLTHPYPMDAPPLARRSTPQKASG